MSLMSHSRPNFDIFLAMLTVAHIRLYTDYVGINGVFYGPCILVLGEPLEYMIYVFRDHVSWFLSSTLNTRAALDNVQCIFVVNRFSSDFLAIGPI